MRRDATDRPLVSAITIFLDGAPFLGEAIESVLAQTYPEWELLLVDDGSTDGSSEVARAYAAAHPGRIHYMDHEGHRNRGMSASRNLGLRRARGELVAFLDGDDVWLPEKLEAQVAILAAHPDAGMTASATRLWFGWTGTAADAARDAARTIHQAPDGLHRPPALLLRFLRDEALTPATCSVLIRRETLAVTGGFEERFRGLYEDQAYFIKAYLKLACVVTGEAHDLYRQHADSHSAVALRAGRYSLDRPSPALIDLYAWCVRYFVRERVRDRDLWKALLSKIGGVGLYRLGSALAVLGDGASRGMAIVNRPARRVLAAWYRVRYGRSGERR